MQLRRSAAPGLQTRPGVGADPDHATERHRLVAMADRAHEVRHLRERRPHLLLGVGAHLEDEEAGAPPRAGLYRALRLSHRRGGILRKGLCVATTIRSSALSAGMVAALLWR